jgi:hypothetical protein
MFAGMALGTAESSFTHAHANAQPLTAAQAAHGLGKAISYCFMKDQVNAQEQVDPRCMELPEVAQHLDFPEAQGIIEGCSATNAPNDPGYHSSLRRDCLVAAYRYLAEYSRPETTEEIETQRWKAGLVLAQCTAMPYQVPNPSYRTEYRSGNAGALMNFRSREACMVKASHTLGLDSLAEMLSRSCRPGSAWISPWISPMSATADCRQKLLEDFREMLSRR